MIELRPTQFPVIAGLREWLGRMGYAAEYGSAVLERNNPGRVFADSHRNPSAALVWSRSGYCFLLGKPSGRFLAATQQNGPVTPSLPRGTELRPISGPLVEQLMSFKPFIRRFWGDAQQFAAHGFGFCVLAQGTIVSECHSAWVGGGVHEVGVETAARWRR